MIPNLGSNPSPRGALLWLMIVLLLAPALTSAADRIALVVGNSAYPTKPLKNAANDAEDMAAALHDLGFKVVRLENASFREMIKAFEDFTRNAPQFKVRLVYYAGHGVQSQNRNYLIPVDAEIKTMSELDQQTVHFDEITHKLAQTKAGVNILILDACREDPFIRSIVYDGDGRAIHLRGPVPVKPGLAQPSDTAVGSFTAFSTKPGEVARENVEGRNSVFAHYLLKYIPTPGLRIEDLFQQIRKAVRHDTNDKQVPWENTTLEGAFCFRSTASGGCGGSLP